MNPRVRDMLIGLTAIVGVLLISWMLMSFGELSGVTRDYQRLVIRTSSARGVSPVAPVTFNGVRIGDVTNIGLAEDGSGEALINIRFFEGIEIPQDFELFLDTGFIGVASLEFVAGPGPHEAFVAGEGEAYDREIGSLVASLRDQVIDRLDRLDQTADEISSLAETYNDVGNRLANVIDSDNPEEQDLRGMVTRLESVLGEAETILAEGEMVTKLGDSIDAWKAAAEGVSTETTRLSDRANQSFDKMDSAVVSIDQAALETRDVIARINRGEGTLGQLSTNDDLFRSLDATVQQLQSLIRDARLLIEKFRDEGVPINL